MACTCMPVTAWFCAAGCLEIVLCRSSHCSKWLLEYQQDAAGPRPLPSMAGCMHA